MGKLKPLTFKEPNPDLYEWKPGPDAIFYTYDGENVVADYDNKIGSMEKISTLPVFFIRKSHYKTRMAEIVHYLNYFTHFYDLDRETFFSMMSVKYYQDTHLEMPQKDFLKKVLDEIVTPRFVAKCKMMSCDLYKLNINADTAGKFNNTPKITNAQAFQIVAVSFSFKLLTPLMLHFASVNTNFDPTVKTEYIKWFDKLFNRIIHRFEENDVKFYTSLCRFVVFRAEKLYRNNMTATYQKKMLHGDTIELHSEDLIRNVVCVKTLYKLDYRKSCVAFIDGVIHIYNTNYLKEKFPSKPYEIDSDDSSKDSDESLSHAEALEMTTYKRDESAAMIADINSDYVMKQLREWYKAFQISDEEFNFYYRNFYPNDVNQFLFNNFYAAKFRDPYAVANLNRENIVYLLICLKKVFIHYKMYHLAALCTAQQFARYKENLIKNTKFMDEITNSQEWKQIIVPKYANLMELEMKDNPLLKMLCTMINSAYVLVDYDPTINGYNLDHLDRAAISHEYLVFLSII